MAEKWKYMLIISTSAMIFTRSSNKYSNKLLMAIKFTAKIQYQITLG